MDANTTVIEVAKDYRIHIQPGELFLLEVPCDASHRSADFKHPNIVRTTPKKLNYRHYHANGGKSWEERQGIVHYFVVARKDITIIPEQGYSYVKATINGAEVTFNVSGGTDGKAWGDFLSLHPSLCSNNPIATLKAIAEVAIRGSAYEPIKTFEEIEEEFYAQHGNDWIVTAAWGAWQKGVPKGMVGVCARKGGHRAYFTHGDTTERWFLVPDAEYGNHGEGQGRVGFVIDPARHQEVEDFTRAAVVRG